MKTLTLQNYRTNDLAKLTAFLQHYCAKYPDAKLARPEFYTFHPALEAGENVFCVLDSAQQLVGFAPVFPGVMTDANSLNGPHDVWTIILALPDSETGEQVRELLFHRAVEKVQNMKAQNGLSQVRLAADMMVSQQDDMDYLLRQGFVPFEQVYVMARETAAPIPSVHVSMPLTLRQTNLSSQAEQAEYLQAHHVCFPENPKTSDDLRMLLQSPLWDKGRMIAAYSSSNELVGSLLVHWDEQKGYGVTDDVMVLPRWRGQNIAKHLIGEGTRYFQTQGIANACLEVKASNTPAVSAYTAMGYRVINRESLLGKLI